MRVLGPRRVQARNLLRWPAPFFDEEESRAIIGREDNIALCVPGCGENSRNLDNALRATSGRTDFLDSSRGTKADPPAILRPERRARAIGAGYPVPLRLVHRADPQQTAPRRVKRARGQIAAIRRRLGRDVGELSIHCK
jgi:hypothetical protein